MKWDGAEVTPAEVTLHVSPATYTGRSNILYDPCRLLAAPMEAAEGIASLAALTQEDWDELLRNDSFGG